MKPMNPLYAGLFFASIIISFGGWYGNMVTDYADLGTTDPLYNTSPTDILNLSSMDPGHGQIIAEVNQTQADMISSTKDSISKIPILGGVLVQVFSVYQVIRSFIMNLWNAFSVGSALITGIAELIPFALPPQIINLAQIGFGLMFISTVVLIILRRKVD